MKNSSRLPFRLLAGMLIAGSIAAVLAACGSPSPKATPPVFVNSAPPAFSPLPAASAEHKAVPPVQLEWEPMEQAPEAVPDAILPPDAEEIGTLNLQQFGGVRLELYTRSGDTDYVYARLLTPAGFYGLGEAGTYNYRKPEDFQLEEVSVFGIQALKLTGTFGANTSVSSYYTVDEEGAPAGLLRVDTGHAVEQDVDRDGWMEVVSAAGLPMRSTLYRRHDGRIERADINQALGADSVVYTREGLYEASDIGGSAAYYCYTPDGLIPAVSGMR